MTGVSFISGSPLSLTHAFAASDIPKRIDTPRDDSNFSQSWSDKTSSSGMLARSLALGGIRYRFKVDGEKEEARDRGEARKEVWKSVESLCGDPTENRHRAYREPGYLMKPDRQFIVSSALSSVA